MKLWDDSTALETPAAYWRYQAFYWGIFTAIGLAINLVNGGNTLNLVISHILFFFYSVGLTHVFRGLKFYGGGRVSRRSFGCGCGCSRESWSSASSKRC